MAERLIYYELSPDREGYMRSHEHDEFKVFYTSADAARRAGDAVFERLITAFKEKIAAHKPEIEAAAAEWIRQRTGVVVPEAATLPRGAIVAVARVTGCVEASSDPWFMGPFGWTLTEVVALPFPIPIRGAQGLWPMHAEVAREALAAWRRVHG